MPTATEDLQISQSLGLLSRLREAAADFAQKETRLTRDFAMRRTTGTRRHRAETEGMETWLTTEIARAESLFAEEKLSGETRCETRRQRIEQARQRGLDDLMEQARKARERHQGQLQMRHFNATRSLPLQLKAEEEAFAAFSRELSLGRAAFTRLQRRLRGAFRGYPGYLRSIRNPREVRVVIAEGAAPLLEKLRGQLPIVDDHLSAFRKFFLPALFSFLPLYVLVPLVLAPVIVPAFQAGSGSPAFVITGLVSAVLIAGIFALHRLGARQSGDSAASLAAAFVEARNLLYACTAAAETGHKNSCRKIQKDYDALCEEVNAQWADAGEMEKTFAAEIRQKIEHQAPRLLEKNSALFLPRLQQCESRRTARLDAINRQAETWRNQIASSHTGALEELAAEEAAAWRELSTEWQQTVTPLYQALESRNALLDKVSPAWDAAMVENWTPATDFPPGVKFAALPLDLEREPSPKDPRLALPGPPRVSAPLALTFPAQGSLLFETSDSGAQEVIGTLNAIILRLLAAIPPGKLSFTIIDPVGLGQNFAGLMHLADYEESLINRRIWTQRDQIEERLAELNAHIEKVIQMYLRNEYATITEYNAKAGSVAEKYHFLVVAGFPANFSETAAKRLQSIAASGARCGVFTLIHWNHRLAAEAFVPEDLRKNSVCLLNDGKGWTFVNEQIRADEAPVFEQPPPPALAIRLVHRIGKSSIDSNRVEVPFSQIAPADAGLWTNDTTQELRIPIGRTGATKLQYLAIGRGTRQHALFAGKTGSGKSTLFHVIITNLALSCSPEQVEFYLIDFKKGVEFKCYATHRLPHARVVAIESDREFALSVLRRVDAELKRRGDLFRALGVQDLAGYKKAGGTEPVPRTLLLIDEFQEFFVEDDEIAQTASLLFDRIVRQGRAFGIHVLLGSQTLGGAYTLARTTLGQMVIRVALQCNEADAYLIMDDNNAAPRLLSRPGEGIYNDAAGAIEGNSPFQVVWLSDEERDARLEKIRALAQQRGCNGAAPIVFEGNAPADIRENALLHSALEGSLPSASPRCWLGAPNSIKGPTEVAFPRQSGSHLLIVGQREETIATMLANALLALAAQSPRDTATFFVFHAGGPDARDPLTELASSLPGVTLVRPDDVTRVMAEISAELQARTDSADTKPPIFVLIPHLQKFKKLRHEDGFDFSGASDSPPSPGAQFHTLLSEGGSQGIHLLVSLDTFANIGRTLSRKALGEFEMRVVFQMSANDSASLIDSPQAGTLGLHRALFYNEHEGSLETFRPYAPPDPDWMKNACRKLERKS